MNVLNRMTEIGKGHNKDKREIEHTETPRNNQVFRQFVPPNYLTGAEIVFHSQIKMLHTINNLSIDLGIFIAILRPLNIQSNGRLATVGRANCNVRSINH